MRKFFLFIAALCCASMFASEETTWSVTVDGKKMTADVYFPSAGHAPYPTFVLIPPIGGTGKGTLGNTPLKPQFEVEGYAFVAINYYTQPKPYGSATLPLPIDETRGAIREFLRYGAETGKLDTTFVVVAGFSLGGGYLAAMAGLTKNIDSYTVGSETWDFYGAAGSYPVDAVIDFSGPVEFRNIGECNQDEYQMPALYQQMIGCSYADCPDKWALASANTYITKDAPPIFISHGTNDPIVPYCVSETFYNNLKAAGVDCEFFTHEKGHTENPGSEFTTKVTAFVHRVRAAKQSQGIESPSLQGRSGEASKVIRDGQLVIERNGKTYNALGTEVK